MAEFANLQQLARLLSQNSIDFLDPLKVEKPPSTKQEQLYKGIINGDFKDEKSAIQQLYGEDQSTPAFQMTKLRLQRSLLNSIAIIDTNSKTHTAFQKALYDCQKNLAIVKILLGRYLRPAAIELAQKVLKTAIKFEFTEVTLEILRILTRHYASITGNKKKFLDTKRLLEKYQAIYMAEIKVENFYSELIIAASSSRSRQSDLIEKSKRFFKKTKKLLNETQSYKIYLFSYMIFVFRYELENDYKNAYSVSQEALEYFENNKHLASNAVIFGFRLRVLASCIRLKKFVSAKKTVDLCLNISQKGTHDWFITQDYHMILSFHTKDYQNAYQVCQEVIREPSFKRLPASRSEPWLVYEAFVNYFVAIGKIKVPEEVKKIKFRVNKFLNEVPLYTKDKRGTNISILILQVLFLLQQKRYGDISDRMDALNAYSYRYLRKNETFRSNCFIKMLLCLPASGFHKQGVLRRAKKYEERLATVPLELANQNAELEVVPYETLWSCVLESLDNRFH